MDRDGLWASVIYGPLSLGFPIDDPALQSACYAAWNDWAVEEFNAVAPDRLCVLAFLPGHSPEAAAAELERCAGARPPRRDHRRLRHRRRRPGLGPAVGRRGAHRPADQLPHQGRHLVEAQLPDRQVAVGGVRHAPAAAARRAARDHGVLRRARAASRPQARARGVGHRLAAVLPGAHGPRVARPARQARLRDQDPAERAVPPPGDGHVRGGRARRRSSSRCSAPTRACGRRTIRTPTARSPTRGARSRRRSARCPTADRRKITATNCARLYGFAHAS